MKNRDQNVPLFHSADSFVSRHHLSTLFTSIIVNRQQSQEISIPTHAKGRSMGIWTFTDRESQDIKVIHKRSESQNWNLTVFKYPKSR
jgi:hypothetical protein